MQRKQQGFTLIELMIVVAIIAILAAIAIPLYLNYTARAQSSEAMSLASGLKPDLVEFYNEHGRFPNNPSAAANYSVGAAQPSSINGKYVAQVAILRGIIIAEFCTASDSNCQVNKELYGQALELSPVTSAGAIDWHCHASETSIYKLVPANCRHRPQITP